MVIVLIRFRQLVPLLDRALPADVSSVLGERFLGFAQHMLLLATQWRESVATGFQRLQDVRNALEQLEKGKEWDLSRSGEEYQTLVSNALDTIESCAATAEARSLEWPDLQELKLVHEKLETLKKELSREMGLSEPIPLLVDPLFLIRMIFLSLALQVVVAG